MRTLKINTIYRHWKHNPTGKYNNYIYCTMGVSTPIDNNNSYKTYAVLNATRTDNNEYISIFLTDSGFIHFSSDFDKKLVVYVSLYSDAKPYVREVNEFLSEVPEGRDDENIMGQKYRFEELND